MSGEKAPEKVGAFVYQHQLPSTDPNDAGVARCIAKFGAKGRGNQPKKRYAFKSLEAIHLQKKCANYCDARDAMGFWFIRQMIGRGLSG